MDKLSQLIIDIGELLGPRFGYGTIYLQGIRNTLVLAVSATAIGCLIGFFCGILQTIPVAQNDSLLKKGVVGFVKALVRIYVEIFRGTPMILQAVFVYYGLPYFTDQKLQFTSMWTVALTVVSINTGAYMAESVRGGILSIDIGQTEGAKAIGMTHVQTMTSVILPQAIRVIIPQIGNNLIINIKDTSVMFIIGFMDFFAVHKMAAGATFKYFPSAAFEMPVYLAMTLLASFLLRRLERRLDGEDSFELVVDHSLIMAAGTYSHQVSGSPYDERSREFMHLESGKSESFRPEETGEDKERQDE